MSRHGAATGRGYNFHGEKAQAMLARVREIESDRKLDQFAEYLAEGFTPRAAAWKVYGNADRGNPMLQRIRKRLGPQAV